MKKVLFAVLLFVFVFANTNASVDWMAVQLKTPNMWVNETNYISVFLYDDNSLPIEDATPIVKATPSYPVDLWNFVSCSSAEWRELCWKMDNSFIGLRWAYVATISSKDIEENVKLTVYSDDTDSAKVHPNMELVIWRGWDGSEEKVVETLSDVPKVWNDNVKWLHLLLALVLVSILFYFIYRKLKED